MERLAERVPVPGDGRLARLRRRLGHLRVDRRGVVPALVLEAGARVPGPIGRRAASRYVGTSPAGAQAQLDILLLEGLRRDSRVLEIGCGALHASLPIIRYVRPDRYIGMDPNPWLRAPHLRRRRVRKLTAEKRPRFLTRDDFDARELHVQFDYVLSHSILSHATHAQLETFMTKTAGVLAPGGRVVVSVRLAEGNEHGNPGTPDREDLPLADWIYPLVSFFKLATIEAAAARAGLAVEVKPRYTALQTARRPREVHDWLVLTPAASA